jgi:SAM-dependent methyltransferase
MKNNISLFFNLLKVPLKALRSLYYSGNNRFCPVCERSSRLFLPSGLYHRRADSRCVVCGSLERHRLLWLFLQKKTDLFDDKIKKILHIAPESCFESRLRKNFGNNYITADLIAPSAMVKMDITCIQYPEQSFDIILCSHVLEHIQDDKQAMKEIYRVLKNNGFAILIVPISNEETTFEDPSIVDPQERLKYFGQEDHVRVYGLDYIDRLCNAGFKVSVTSVRDLCPEKTANLMGLNIASGNIYYCTK